MAEELEAVGLALQDRLNPAARTAAVSCKERSSRMDLPARHRDASKTWAPLAWVHDELRRSLETAHKSLRRYLQGSRVGRRLGRRRGRPERAARRARSSCTRPWARSNWSGCRPRRRCCAPAKARCRSSPRRARQARREARRQAGAGFVRTARLPGALLAGKPVSPLALFPQYRDVQELAGADRIHPADLWPHDWRWRDIAADGIEPRWSTTRRCATRSRAVLQLMRQGGTSRRGAADLFAAWPRRDRAAPRRHALAASPPASSRLRPCGLLAPDVYSKRIASRLLLQYAVDTRRARRCRSVVRAAGAGPAVLLLAGRRPARPQGAAPAARAPGLGPGAARAGRLPRQPARPLRPGG